MANERILIVDDDPINLKIITMVLERSGYTVCTSRNGREVLAICGAFNPAFILMDVQLPGIDGLELTRRLRADSSNDGVVILVMTAFDIKGDDRRAIETGCDGYLTKPINTRALPQIIEDSLLEKRKTFQQPPARRIKTDSTPVMDIDSFRNRLCDDTVLIHEMIALFFQEYPRMVQQVHSAVSNASPSSLRDAAHALKGVLVNFSAGPAVAIAAALERMGVEGNMNGAAEACGRLDYEVGRLHKTLVEFGAGVAA